MIFHAFDDNGHEKFRAVIGMLNTMYNLRLTLGYEYIYANHSYEVRIKDEHIIRRQYG